jgi:hypothetical protein
MSIKSAVEKMLHREFDNSGMNGLVRMLQINYSMRNIKANVTGSGNEVKIDFVDKEQIENQIQLRRIINNPMYYPNSDVKKAHEIVEQMRAGISQGITTQTHKDKQMFINAKVNKVTFSIGGVYFTSVSL